jgi:hypothetical protein
VAKRLKKEAETSFFVRDDPDEAPNAEDEVDPMLKY